MGCLERTHEQKTHKGRLSTQPARFHDRGREGARGGHATSPDKGLLEVHDLEVLGLLIPLQDRGVFGEGETLHPYPAALYPLQKLLGRMFPMNDSIHRFLESQREKGGTTSWAVAVVAAVAPASLA